MSGADLMERLLNPAVVLSMIGAGIAYGWFLWALHIRPNLTLWLAAVAPGATFLAVIWSIRAMQGVVASTYIALLVDWLIFSNAAFVAVLAARRWKARR
jgi:hypothetical protein